MALTNVEMCIGDDQWKSITIDEAIKEYPIGKVSAVSGIFRCKLCKQFVTLTAPGINSRCFKHSRGDLEKDCDDRSLSSTFSQFEMHSFIPPIRIEIKNPKLFSLEMGFILPPDITNPKGIIEITSDDLVSNVSLYDISRLNYDCLTYLGISNIPSERYIIKCDNEQFHLSNNVEGIKKTGVLFDYITRKKLPDKGNVRFDFDVNIIPQKIKCKNSPEHLRKVFFDAVQKIYTTYGFNSKPENSTSVITLKKVDHKNSKCLYGCDFAIVRTTNKGRQQNIVLNKQNNKQSYVWEDRGDYYDGLTQRVDFLKKNSKYWNELRHYYIEKKNTNYSKEKKSRAIYAESVKEICDKHGYHK